MSLQSYSMGDVDPFTQLIMGHDVDWYRQQELNRQQNEFSSLEAQKSRDWQERMSNTAYQRASADMQAAGFNPALMFSQGGASTPSGSTAHASSSAYNARFPFGDMLKTAVGIATQVFTAFQRSKTASDIATIEAMSREYVADKYGNGYRSYKY